MLLLIVITYILEGLENGFWAREVWEYNVEENAPAKKQTKGVQLPLVGS